MTRIALVFACALALSGGALTASAAHVQPQRVICFIWHGHHVCIPWPCPPHKICIAG